MKLATPDLLETINWSVNLDVCWSGHEISHTLACIFCKIPKLCWSETSLVGNLLVREWASHSTNFTFNIMLGYISTLYCTACIFWLYDTHSLLKEPRTARLLLGRQQVACLNSSYLPDIFYANSITQGWPELTTWVESQGQELCEWN